MPHRYQTILLFGAPGSGKGTQGKILGQIPGFYHLSCGDVFRSLDMNSALGALFREYSSRGRLVPDDATIKMWHQNIHAQTTLSRYKPKQDLLVLDGIPRNVAQAKLMDRHIRVLKIIHLVCIDKEKMVDLETADRRIDIRIECRPCRPFGIATWDTVGTVREMRVRALSEAEKKVGRE